MTGGSVTKPPMLAVLCPSVPRLERGQVAKAGVCRSAGRGVNSIAQRKEISLSKMTLQIPAKTLAYNRLLLLWRRRGAWSPTDGLHCPVDHAGHYR